LFEFAESRHTDRKRSAPIGIAGKWRDLAARFMAEHFVAVLGANVCLRGS